MAEKVTATFFYNDGSKLSFEFPRQADDDALTAMGQINKALEQDKFAAVVDGDLLIIPLNNVKYVQVSPAPKDLPKGIIRPARFAK